MCLQCDGFSADDAEAQMTNMIQMIGFVIQYIESEAGSRSYGYTIGLSALGHQEFLVQDLDVEDTAIMLQHFALDVLENNSRYGPGHTANYHDGRILYFSKMHGAHNLAFGAYRRYGEKVSVLEIHFVEQLDSEWIHKAITS